MNVIPSYPRYSVSDTQADQRKNTHSTRNYELQRERHRDPKIASGTPLRQVCTINQSK